jgi:DNA replication and repair protein RecF
MYLKRLYLRNFRCYPEAEFQFSPEINMIVGENATGKTTVLEAISLLMTGRSFRTSHLADLICQGSSSFYVEASFIKHQMEQTLRFAFDGQERWIAHHHTRCQSATALLGLLLGVVLVPDDVALIKGSPLARRQFLDLQISQVDPLYVHHLTRYHRAMRHRNILLKAKQKTTLESWEHEMANAAAYLTWRRAEAIAHLMAEIQPLYQTLSATQERLLLTYKSAVAAPHGERSLLREEYLRQWHKLRTREMMLGTTLMGPHREDLLIAIGEREVRFFGSEGQQRSCVAALRFAEWQQLSRNTAEHPLMLLDDIGMSLDGQRRRHLIKQLPPATQIFLTATEDIVSCHTGKAHLITCGPRSDNSNRAPSQQEDGG